jgi:tetratricopeptide (TPR) repeat protein
LSIEEHELMKRLLASMLWIGCFGGCSLPGTKDQSVTQTGPKGWMATASRTADGVKGQAASLGTVVQSAYGKAKQSLSRAITPKATSAEGSVEASGNLGPELYVAQGQLYESSGQYAKALDFYSKALVADPNHAAALASLARLHKRQDECVKAIDYYQRASAASPADVRLIWELAECQKASGQSPQALESYRKALLLDPQNRESRIGVAGLLLAEGKEAEALEVVGQGESPAMAHYQIAYLHFSRQDLAGSQDSLQKALQLDPNLQPARQLLEQIQGSSMVQQGRQVYQAIQPWMGSPSANPAASAVPASMPSVVAPAATGSLQGS